MDKFGVVRADITPENSNPLTSKDQTELEKLDNDLVKQSSKAAESRLRGTDTQKKRD